MKNLLAVFLFLFLPRVAAAAEAELVEAPARGRRAGPRLRARLGERARLGLGGHRSRRRGAGRVGFSAVGLTSGIAVRFVTKVGFALEPRVGLDGALLAGAAASTRSSWRTRASAQAGRCGSRGGWR